MYTPQTWSDGNPAFPASAARFTNLENATRDAHDLAGGIFLDSYSGTDDAKLTSAIAAQQAAVGTNMPPIVLPIRPLTFNTPRTLYSGCKIIGARVTGQKNLEQSGGQFMGSPEITLGSGITSGTGSWWNGTGTLFDVYMADFAVAGNGGSSVHQFMDVVNTGGSLYACEFRSLSFNFMRSVFGRKDRLMGFTQVNLTGTWTINNLWDTQLNIGGSDNQLWMAGYVNMGPSSSAAQTGTYADNDYELMFQSLSNTTVGYIYMTALNGWRGLRVTGAASSLTFNGGVYEGYKPTRINGLLSGPAPGTVIRLDDGACTFHGTFIGQGMDNPDVAEDGLVQVNDGEHAFYSPNFYGANMATANAIDHNGGRLLVMGASKRQSEGWSNRPLISTAFGPGTGANAFYCPDGSMGSAPIIGIPAGGTTGQALLKTSGTDYAVNWGTN